MLMNEKLLLCRRGYMLEINNRRYIGSKYKLLSKIDEQLEGIDLEGLTFADVFAGTGVVGYHFAEKGMKVIVNDILLSNVVVYNAFLSSKKISIDLVNEYLEKFNNLKYNDINDNYFSDVYGNKYFSKNDAKKIGYIRDVLQEDKEKMSDREYCYLLTSLLYATDRIANTVGHFEHFLSKKPIDTNFVLQPLDIKNIKNAKIYNEDANKLIKKIKSDITYIDPPYNARQYVNFYHVLENLARWNKPTEFEGNSMKFKRDELKSGYSRSEAPNLFDDLISNLNTKLIIVSYNNTYTANSIASNNKITEEQLITSLRKRGKVTKTEIAYKGFNAGKTDFKDHKEYLFKCEVAK